jgi:hypothetical protein
MKLKHYTSDYPKAKRCHSAALRAPQIMPLTGDGPLAAAISRRGWASQEGRDALRTRLVDARYADWQASQFALLADERFDRMVEGMPF